MTTARVLDEYCDAWRAGDLARLIGSYHDEFTLHYFGESPLAGTHRGKASALAALGEATRRSGRQLVEIVDVLAGHEPGAIVAIARVGPSGETAGLRRVLSTACATASSSNAGSTTRTSDSRSAVVGRLRPLASPGGGEGAGRLPRGTETRAPGTSGSRSDRSTRRARPAL